MNNKLSHIVKLIVAGQVFSLSTPASATVSSVVPTPGQLNAAIGRTTLANVNWRVTKGQLTTATFSCGATVTSTTGTFRAGSAAGPIVGTVNRTLTSTTTCPPYPALTTSNIPESVAVPASILYRAQQSGYTAVVYQRSFTDGFGAVVSTVTFPIVSGSAGAFSIENLSLRFDDDTVLRIVEEGTDIRAYVDIKFNGNGLLQGVWELANPGSTAGSPLYQPLRVVRQKLVAGRSSRLPSPPLPSLRHGVHLVRFRITEPELPVQDPVIKYFVATRDEIKQQQQPAAIELLEPFNKTMLGKDTTFRWQAVTGARAYQLELYGKQQPTVEDTLPDIGALAVEQAPPRLTGAPAAGVLVRGDKTETTLPENTRSRINSGEIYYWRLLAVGEDGNVIGISPIREIKIP